MENLLPLLRKAPSLRRVVTVAGGGFEGSIDSDDFQALRAPTSPPELRERLSTLITLGLEAVGRTAPDVSFIHDYPGTVKTPLLKDVPEEMLKGAEFVPLDECGERHVYLATSARYPPKSGDVAMAPLSNGIKVAIGSNGELGSGVYSVGVDCETASATVLEKLRGLRENGMVDAVWNYTEGEFKRIAEASVDF
jgi:hypothetical protein